MSMHEYPDSPRSAVGAIVIRGDKVLLVKRGNSPARDYGRSPVAA